MVYFLHITRRRFWATAGAEIAAEEWRELLQQDPEFKVPGSDGPGFADWYCPVDGEVRTLWMLEGDVSALNPDRLFVVKLFEIARRLGARVQGDEGEVCRESSQVIYAELGSAEIAPPSRWAWWKRWLRGGLLTPTFCRWRRDA